MSKAITIPEDIITNKIYFIRNQKVMLDRDLAKLYGVKTKVLKQAIRRNIKRFPEDFMFEMTKEELDIWRSQIVTSKSDKKGLRHSPFCFTEQGIAMLSSVLKSDRAIEVNIKIIRIFTKMRKMLANNLNLKLEIEEIKKKLTNHSKNIELVFNYLDELIEKKEKPRTKIGYKNKIMSKAITIPEDIITNKIYFIRNQKVMLDRDLAKLYGVKNIRLREQVKRNIEKFPEHFMFRLSLKETQLMVSQNAIPSKKHLGGSLPFVFTEHGILQLANVIKSNKATQISIKIIEIFVQMRETLNNNLNLKLEVENIKKQLTNHSKNIELVFDYLDELIDKKETPRTKIGYKK